MSRSPCPMNIFKMRMKSKWGWQESCCKLHPAMTYNSPCGTWSSYNIPCGNFLDGCDHSMHFFVNPS